MNSQIKAEQKAILRKRHGFERMFAGKVKQALYRQIKPVTDSWENTNSLGLVSASNIDMISIIELFSELYRAVGVAFARSSYLVFKQSNEHGVITKKEPEQVPDDIEREWIEYFREYAFSYGSAKVTGITETTRDYIRSVVTQAVDKGWSIPKTVRELRRAMIPRALLIARTEILSASNAGQYIGSKAVADNLGLELEKVWLATFDFRTRDTHRQANGQTVGMNDNFTINGYEAMHPGDPNLPVSEVVMCRCTHYYQRKNVL